MKAWRLSLLFLGLITLATAAQGQSTIRIANGEWPPYLSQHSPHYGYASHLVSDALASQGINIEWSFLPWQRAFVLTQFGSYDVSIVWKKTPEREEKFLFSEPVLESNDFLFMRKDNFFDWENQDEVKDRTLGIYQFTPKDFLPEKLEQAGIDLIDLPDFDLMVNALISRRVDGIILNKHVGEQMLHQMFPEEVTNEITSHPVPLARTSFHAIISRSIPNSGAIKQTIDEGLATIRKNGRYDALTRDFVDGKYGLYLPSEN